MAVFSQLPSFAMLSPVFVGILLAIAALAFSIYRLFFASLAKLPGPKITALTQLWVMYHEFKGDRTVKLDELHRKYGPVVRVSPSEVSFNSQEALREIYGASSTYSKSHFYDMFIYYNERNTFTSLSKGDHSSKKRLVADRYTKSYVMQPSVAERVRTHAASFMKELSKSSKVDVYMYLHYFALDVITNHLYGGFGTKTLSEERHRQLVYDLSGVKHRTRLYMIFYFGALMDVLEKIKAFVRKLSGQPGDFHVRGSNLNSYGKDSVVGFREQSLEKDQISTCSKLLRAVPDNNAQIAAECMDHLVAGVDTTGDAMCITMWRMSTPEYKHVQDKLFEELKSIDQAFDSETQTAPIAALDQLPYLDAVIHEGMRWRPPVPMTLFRIVPQGGRMINGFMIPPGTTVGCQSYSLHRVEDVFPDPDKFDPERWMTSDKEKLSTMKAHFWPFSSGGRMCLGHNIAMVEMKTIIASTYRYYKTRATPETTEESMAMDDQLTSGVPYGLKCVLDFERR